MLLVILAALFFRYLYLSHYEPPTEYYQDRLSEVQFVEVEPYSYDTKKKYIPKKWQATARQKKKESPKKQALRFAFDPNTLSVDSLQLLGLPKYLSTNIAKYRARGGTFEKAEDFSKIYGMEKYYDSLAPLIQVDTAAIAAKKAYKRYQKEKEKQERKQAREAELEAQRVVVDINTADSLTLLSLRGIGPFYTKTILEHRQRLGGFVDIDQIAEAYAVPDTIVDVIGRQWLTIGNTPTRKIDINTADFKTLIRHPYLDKKQTNAILMYRKAHNGYTAIDDLKKIHLISDEAYAKISPYVTVTAE